MLYILIIIIGGILSYFGPWWVIAPVVLALSWWKAKNSAEAAIVSAAAVVSLWAGYSTFLNVTADVNLVDKIGSLFTGGQGFLAKIPTVGLVFGIISLLASILGAAAGAAGVQIREYFK